VANPHFLYSYLPLRGGPYSFRPGRAGLRAIER
jgi:hypothetical protein